MIAVCAMLFATCLRTHASSVCMTHALSSVCACLRYAVKLNKVGLPLREGQETCPYYQRTGACKFGPSCKFNHPNALAPTQTSASDASNTSSF